VSVLAVLHGLPQRVVNDPQLRHLLDDPLLPRIEPRHPLAGVGVLDEALPVPDEATDVELVVEDAVAALGVAVDGAESPLSAAGCRDVRRVQLRRDPLGRSAGRVLAEDVPHDRRLGLVDPAFAEEDDCENGGRPHRTFQIQYDSGQMLRRARPCRPPCP